jgi:hypothetical protein
LRALARVRLLPIPVCSQGADREAGEQRVWLAVVVPGRRQERAPAVT